jgi:hypothetical protein
MSLDEESILHCYRCVYSWRPRRGRPSICPRCKSKLWQVPRVLPRPRHPEGLGVAEIVAPHRTAIRRLARRYGVKSFRAFGSVARGEADEGSDVDLLYEAAQPIGLLARVELRLALEELFGRRVDLCQVDELKWSVRPQALADATPI